MHIPTKLKIMGHEYEIINCHELSRRQRAGECDSYLLKIRLSDDNKVESVRTETLMHEILEALSSHLDINMEHHALSVLSEGILAVIRDNDLDFRKPQ